MTPRRLSLLSILTVICVALALVPGLTTPSSAAAPKPDPTLVRVDGGWLRGEATDRVLRFSGIPYAAPPVGPRRWAAPAPARSWDGVRPATSSGPKCPQPGYEGGEPVVIGDEDCLYLDVVRPRRPRSRGLLPVLVWVHGGNLASGSGSEYDGARLATRGDVVVVTVNHRLGALGFLSSPELDAGGQVSGSYGLLDQAAALRWVRRNVRALGGDPRRVTLAGQSAGARSVCAHLGSPASRGLYQRAIVQSGACTTRVMNKAQADAKGEQAIAALGCADAVDVAGCLREVPPADLLGKLADRGNPFLRERRDDPWGPVAGTPFLPRQPGRALRQGHAAGVPLLVGSMREEARGPVLGNLPDLTPEEYAELVDRVFGEDAESVLAAYPADDRASPALTLAAVLTDWGYSCPTVTTARAAARHAPVYAYEMREKAPPVEGVRYGAYHGWDLPFLWKTSIPFTSYPPLSRDQRRLSATMIEYWTTFARSGNPNGGNRPTWRPFSRGHRLLGLEADDVRSRPAGAGHRCGFWGSL